VAEDSFLPRRLTRRGHRLAFFNGIIVLTVLSLPLVLVLVAAGQRDHERGLRDYERPIPPDGTDSIGSLQPTGAGHGPEAPARPRSGRPSTTACWPARSPTPRAT